MDWVTISSLATAAGTLVLAVATFASGRSANRTARVAEIFVPAGGVGFWQGSFRDIAPDDYASASRSP